MTDLGRKQLFQASPRFFRDRYTAGRSRQRELTEYRKTPSVFCRRGDELHHGETRVTYHLWRNALVSLVRLMNEWMTYIYEPSTAVTALHRNITKLKCDGFAGLGVERRRFETVRVGH